MNYDLYKNNFQSYIKNQNFLEIQTVYLEMNKNFVLGIAYQLKILLIKISYPILDLSQILEVK